MLDFHRSAAFGFVLALLLSCGGAEPHHAPDGEYWPVHDTLPPPAEGMAGLSKPRLIVAGDSVYYYTPIYGKGQSFPAYAADSTARFTDSMYVVYQMREDSAMELVMHGPQGASPNRRLELRPPGMQLKQPAETIVGKTYRFDIEGLLLLIYFGDTRTPMATFHLRAGSGLGPVEIRRVTPALTGQRGSITSISYAESVGVDRVKVHRLVVDAMDDGEPQLYLFQDTLGDDPVIAGPYPGRVYMSIVPMTEADQNVVARLQQGRIERLPPLDWNRDGPFLPATFPRYRGVSPRQAAQLDFEFRDDGTFVLLTGSEVLDEGSWGLSTDRTFLILDRGGEYSNPVLYPILAYTEAYLTIELPVKIQSDQNEHTALVPIRFYAP